MRGEQEASENGVRERVYLPSQAIKTPVNDPKVVLFLVGGNLSNESGKRLCQHQPIFTRVAFKVE